MYSYLEDVNGGFLIYTKDLEYFKSLEGIDFFGLVECGRGTLEEIEKSFGKLVILSLQTPFICFAFGCFNSPDSNSSFICLSLLNIPHNSFINLSNLFIKNTSLILDTINYIYIIDSVKYY